MTDDRELEVARRRIEQLEAALMRRTELLEQKQAELANIKASRAYKLVALVQKGFHRFFPIHTRRRAFVRTCLRSAGSAVAWVFDARKARNGPPPEERHLSEASPPVEYRRWVNRFEPRPAAGRFQIGGQFASENRIVHERITLGRFLHEEIERVVRHQVGQQIDRDGERVRRLQEDETSGIVRVGVLLPVQEVRRRLDS